jgi:hypothetical protein
MDVRRRQTLTGLGAIPLPPQLEQGSYGDSFSPHFAGFISTFWPVPKQYLHVVSFGIDASSNQPSLAVRGGSRGLVGPATHSRTDLSTPERQWLCCVPSPPSWSLFLGQRGDTGSVECWRPARVQRASGRGLANEGYALVAAHIQANPQLGPPLQSRDGEDRVVCQTNPRILASDTMLRASV